MPALALWLDTGLRQRKDCVASTACGTGQLSISTRADTYEGRRLELRRADVPLAFVAALTAFFAALVAAAVPTAARGAGGFFSGT